MSNKEELEKLIASTSSVAASVASTSSVTDEKSKNDKELRDLNETIKNLVGLQKGETDKGTLKKINDSIQNTNYEKNKLLKKINDSIQNTTNYEKNKLLNKSSAALTSSVAASVAPTSTVAQASSTNPAASLAVFVYVKIGADNSIEILDSIPASAELTKSSFYDVIKNDITSDTYIAMNISETCSNDDSCIQYNGTNYSMDLQNSAIRNKPLDTNFLKVKDSATNASSPSFKGKKVKEGKVGEGEKVGEVEGEKVEGEEVEEGEKVGEVENKSLGEGENKSLEEIKKEIPEKKEINEEWNKFANLIIEKIDSLNEDEDQKVPLLKELLKIKNTQIIANIDDPNILENSKKYNNELINESDNLKDYKKIMDYLEGVHIYSSLEDIDGGMSMNIFH